MPDIRIFVTVDGKEYPVTFDREPSDADIDEVANSIRAENKASAPKQAPQASNTVPSRSSVFGKAPAAAIPAGTNQAAIPGTPAWNRATTPQTLFGAQTPAPQSIAPQRPVQPQQNLIQQALLQPKYTPGTVQPPRPQVNVQQPKIDFKNSNAQPLMSASTTTTRLPFAESDLMASLRDGVSAVRGLNGKPIPIGSAVAMYQATYGKPPSGFGQTTDDQQARQFATNYGQTPIKGETPSLGAEFTPQRVGKVIKGLTDIPFGLTKDALRLGLQAGGQDANIPTAAISQLGDKLNLVLPFVMPGFGAAYLAQIGGSFIEPSMQSLQDGTIDPFVAHIKALAEGLNPLESTKTTSEKIEAAGMLALIMFGVVHGTKGLARANTILKPLEKEFGLTRQQTLSIYNTVREGMVKGNQEALGAIRGSLATLTDGINPAKMREMMRPIASKVSNPDSFAAWTRAQNSTLPGTPPATQGQPVVLPQPQSVVQPQPELQPKPVEAPKAETLATETRPTEQTQERWVNPDELKVNPKIQYKSDAKGPSKTTSKYAGVDNYNREQGGVLSAWERLNGDLEIAHGHHRAELAQRATRFTSDTPNGPIDVPRQVRVRMLREADGWTLEKVRQNAAIENLRNGDGSALDAAMVLHELKLTPDEFSKLGITMRGSMQRNTVGLMGLDPSNLNLIALGEVPEHVAAGIGSVKGMSPELQAYALRHAKNDGIHEFDSARLYAQKVRDSAFETAPDQTILFGDDEPLLAPSFAEQTRVQQKVSQQILSKWKEFKNVADANPLPGEHIDQIARLEEVNALGDARWKLKERLDRMFEHFDDVKQRLRDLGAKVARGEISETDAARDLTGYVTERIKNAKDRDYNEAKFAHQERLAQSSSERPQTGVSREPVTQPELVSEPPTPVAEVAKPAPVQEAAKPTEVAETTGLKPRAEAIGERPTMLPKPKPRSESGLTETQHKAARKAYLESEANYTKWEEASRKWYADVVKADLEGKPIPENVLAEVKDTPAWKEHVRRKMENEEAQKTVAQRLAQKQAAESPTPEPVRPVETTKGKQSQKNKLELELLDLQEEMAALRAKGDDFNANIIEKVEIPNLKKRIAKQTVSESASQRIEEGKAEHPNVSDAEDKFLVNAQKRIDLAETEKAQAKTKGQKEAAKFELDSAYGDRQKLRNIREVLNITDEDIANASPSKVNELRYAVKVAKEQAEVHTNISKAGVDRLNEINGKLDAKEGGLSQSVPTPEPVRPVEAPVEAPKVEAPKTKAEAVDQIKQDLQDLFLGGEAGSLGGDWGKKAELIGKIVSNGVHYLKLSAEEVLQIIKDKFAENHSDWLTPEREAQLKAHIDEEVALRNKSEAETPPVVPTTPVEKAITKAAGEYTGLNRAEYEAKAEKYGVAIPEKGRTYQKGELAEIIDKTYPSMRESDIEAMVRGAEGRPLNAIEHGLSVKHDSKLWSTVDDLQDALREANRGGDKNAIQSAQDAYNLALDKAVAFGKSVKPMHSEWHNTGMAMQEAHSWADMTWDKAKTYIKDRKPKITDDALDYIRQEHEGLVEAAKIRDGVLKGQKDNPDLSQEQVAKEVAVKVAEEQVKSKVSKLKNIVEDLEEAAKKDTPKPEGTPAEQQAKAKAKKTELGKAKKDLADANAEVKAARVEVVKGKATDDPIIEKAKREIKQKLGEEAKAKSEGKTSPDETDWDQVRKDMQSKWMDLVEGVVEDLKAKTPSQVPPDIQAFQRDIRRLEAALRAQKAAGEKAAKLVDEIRAENARRQDWARTQVQQTGQLVSMKPPSVETGIKGVTERIIKGAQDHPDVVAEREAIKAAKAMLADVDRIVATLDDMTAGRKPKPKSKPSRIEAIKSLADLRDAVARREKMYKSRLDKIAELKKAIEEERPLNKKPKTTPDDFYLKQLDEEIKGLNKNLKTVLAKGSRDYGDVLREITRTNVLSSWVTNVNIGGAVGSHTIITPFEELTRGIVGGTMKATGIGRKIAETAGTHAQGSLYAEGKALKGMYGSGKNAANEFLQASAISEAWNKAFKGESTSLEAQAKRFGVDSRYYQKVNKILGFEQNSHGAMKSFTQRNAFARQWAKENAYADSLGLNVNDPAVRVDMFAKAYAKSLEAIMQNDSAGSEALQKILSLKLKDGTPVMSGFKALNPVVKVPFNMTGRALEYTAGLPIGAFKQIVWAKNSASLAKALRSPIRDEVLIQKLQSKLTSVQAEKIMNAYARGGVGAGLMTLGYQLADQIEIDEKTGHTVLFGVQMPKFISHIPWVHAVLVGKRWKEAVHQSESPSVTEFLTKGIWSAGAESFDAARKSPYSGMVQSLNDMQGQFYEDGGERIEKIPVAVSRILSSLLIPSALNQNTKAFDNTHPVNNVGDYMLNSIGAQGEPIQRKFYDSKKEASENAIAQFTSKLTPELRRSFPPKKSGSSSSKEPSDGPKERSGPREPRG